MSNPKLPALKGERVTLRRPRPEDFEARLRLGTAIRAYQKCGFVVEGREREAAFVDGDWYDDVMMAILDQEYMVIHRRKG
jgi:hypothetical protein